jgi:hypothetical protein
VPKTASEVAQEELDDALWVVETSQSGGTILHGPFEFRAQAVEWASNVLRNGSMYGARTIGVVPLFRALP